MKNTILALTLCLISIHAFAAEEPFQTERAELPTTSVSPHSFKIGGKVTSFNYEEPGYMKDIGLLSGIEGSYSFQINSYLAWTTQGEYLQGTLDYDGSIQDVKTGKKTPHQSKQRFYVMDVTTVLSVDPTPESSSKIIPYLGLGFRDTFDNKDEAYDYRRDISYSYIPVGLKLVAGVSKGVKLTTTLEYDHLIVGYAKTYLSDANSKYSDIAPKLGSGSANKISEQLSWSLDSGKKLLVDLSYTQWKVAESEVVSIGDGSGKEPANTTALTSMSVGVQF